MESSIIHILITAVAIPLCFVVLNRVTNKNDELKKKSEEDWRTEVKEKFDGISKKITSFCSENHVEHNELYEARNLHADRIRAIETIHHIKGCDERIEK
ncbi:MAG: hypothetical protein LLG40_13290 [Deltaproteobacteria bacterium]|nr:hypothetical protein [Deltaproteobacteria bacterium]